MRIKKTLLLFPPYPIPKMFPKRAQIPLGVAYLASSLRNEGLEVEILDSVIEGWDHSIKVDSHNIQYGLSIREIVNRISRAKPEILGISCMFSTQVRVSHEIAREVKKVIPDIIVCTGGAHPSAVPEDMASDENIDFVIIGEGEKTLLNLINAIDRGDPYDKIDGICYRRDDGQIILNPHKKYIEDLDSIPFPAFDLLPLERYFEINRPHGTITRNKRIIPIVTSRGCPAKCVFCSIHPVWGRRYRARSPENVVDEIEMLVNRYGAQEIQIEDDNFTYDRARAERICDLLIERRIDVAFTAPNGLAIWALDERLLYKLREVGFYRLTLAVESGSQMTLSRIIHKPLKLEHVIRIIDIANKIGFDIDLFFVVGFPGETLEEMQKTFDLGKSLDVLNVKYFIATPYPGTELLEISRRDNLIPPDFDPTDPSINVVSGIITTEDFTPERLKRLVLVETMKTQLKLFLRHPLRYTTNVLRTYLLKDPTAIFAFLWNIIKARLS